jgi:hypothetical protein
MTAGATKYLRSDSRGTWSANLAVRQAERELAAQAEASYKRMVADFHATAPAKKAGASVTPERA